MFLHQIPPKPAYFRAKVLRRLTQLGALAVKNSAYLLPETDDTSEDLQWLLREIRSEGGEAWIFGCHTVAGTTDEQLRDAFRTLRSADYVELSEAASDLLDDIRRTGPAAASRPSASGRETEWERVKRRYEEIKRIDFFRAPQRAELEVLMAEVERESGSGKASKDTAEGPLSSLRGRKWVTRAGVKIDRIASAWFIRRFVDPAARFVFVNPKQYVHTPGDVRFDMFEGEFTHEGDRCTFEVLVERSGVRDAALAPIAEIVHDIDFKDAKFDRREALGIASLIEGLAERVTDDSARLDEGARIFEDLYAAIAKRRAKGE
jgi:hypothetical protein